VVEKAGKVENDTVLKKTPDKEISKTVLIKGRYLSALYYFFGRIYFFLKFAQ
jgi:hypothetical protein